MKEKLKDAIAQINETIAYVQDLPKDLRTGLWKEDLLNQKKVLVYKLYVEVTNEIKELTRIHYD